MNNIIRTVASATNIRSLFIHGRHNIIPANRIIINNGQFARNLWYMCNHPVLLKKYTQPIINNSIHTKGERELVEFLTEEIVLERKAQKATNIPTEVDGFQVALNGSDVTLTKQSDKEIIKVQFSVSHTVDADDESNETVTEIEELKSKPAFRIDLVRNKTTLSVMCSFQNQDDEYDLFGIDEISVFDGEWNEKVYAVAGQVLDCHLYDLLLNLLEEKGITNEFAEKIINLSTAYEHASYISLLEGLSKFASGK